MKACSQGSEYKLSHRLGAGHIDGRVVTLAWDWMQDERGVLRRLGLRALRSNIIVLDPHSQPLGHAAESALWALVKRHRWGKVVCDSLDASMSLAQPKWRAEARTPRPAKVAMEVPPETAPATATTVPVSREPAETLH